VIERERRDVSLNKRVVYEFFGVESTIQLAFDFVSQKYFASQFKHIAHDISSHILLLGAESELEREKKGEKTIFHI
jgi:hypothetical protein